RVRHAGAINLMALSPSGKWVATVFQNQLFVSDAESLHVVARLSTDGPTLTCVGWSADGTTLAAGRADDRGTVQIWDVPSWNLRKTLVWGKVPIMALAVTPDGKGVATVAREEKSARLWNIESEKEPRPFDGYPAPIRVIQFTADGSQLLVAGGLTGTGQPGKAEDLAIWSFDATTGKKRSAYLGPRYPVIGLGVSNDGKTILAGTERNELWTLGPKAEQCAVLSSNNNVPWTAIALHGDGRYAVAAV